METAADSYVGYAGLLPLAGLLPMSDAIHHGLTVKESVDRLKRLHWSLRRLHRIFAVRIAATPVYELKMAFSQHAHYCAEHVLAIAERVSEMRQPPRGLDVPPHPALDLFFDEVEYAPDLTTLVVELYERAVPAVTRALGRLMSDTNRLFDHPTYRVCRFAQIEMQEIEHYGHEAVRCLVQAGASEALSGWLETLDRSLACVGSLDGTAPVNEDTPERVFSGQPRPYDSAPQRNERLQDPYNMGVNAFSMPYPSHTAICNRAVCPLYEKERLG